MGQKGMGQKGMGQKGMGQRGMGQKGMGQKEKLPGWLGWQGLRDCCVCFHRLGAQERIALLKHLKPADQTYVLWARWHKACLHWSETLINIDRSASA